MEHYKPITIDLPAPLFALAAHPSKPLVSAGLSTGHLLTYEFTKSTSTTPKLIWKTRRHNPSLRSVVYTLDGSRLVSLGTDGLVKAADPETGRVNGKWALPRWRESKGTSLLAVSEKTVIVGTEEGRLYELDVEKGFTGKKWIIDKCDTVSGMVGLPGKEGGAIRQVVVVGGSVLAVVNVKEDGKIVAVSEDQEDEILCVAYCPDWTGKMPQRLLTGMGAGVAGVWGRDHWEDQVERIKVCAGKDEESVDCAIYHEKMKAVAFGTGEGKVRLVKVGGTKWIGELVHDEEEEDAVAALDIDCYWRFVTGGGQQVKIWADTSKSEDGSEDESGSGESDEDSEESESESESSDSEKEEESRKRKRKGKKGPPPPKHIKASFSGLD